MNKNQLIWIIALVGLLVLAACGSGAGSAEPAVQEENSETAVSEDTPTDDEAMGEMSEDEHMDETMAEDEEMDEAMADEDVMEGAEQTAVVAGPEWLTLSLTDARTGEPFSLADFAGRPIYVEPMATWCTNCRRQMNAISAGQDQIPAEAVIIGLSVEPNLDDNVLAGYANNQGYNWLFAVATPELIEAMVNEYGRSVANPPSTPHFIVRPDGSITALSTGFHTIEEIVAQIEQES